MANPRVCPHCHVAIPVDRDFYFDENLNLVCGNCNKIVFPTVKSIPSENPSFDTVVEPFE